MRRTLKWSVNIVLGALLALWAGATVYAFWYFEGQYLRPVARPAGAAVAVPGTRPPATYSVLRTDQGTFTLGAGQPITVLNFWNPQCPCSRYAESDVRRLVQRYQPTGVRFITVIAAGNTDKEVAEASAAWAHRRPAGTATLIDRNNSLAQHFGVWAAPAAVIFDTHGRLAYVGAYNAARYCNDPETAWAAKALLAIVQGQTPPRAKTLFFGCQLSAAAS